MQRVGNLTLPLCNLYNQGVCVSADGMHCVLAASAVWKCSASQRMCSAAKVGRRKHMRKHMQQHQFGCLAASARLAECAVIQGDQTPLLPLGLFCSSP
jgi:hypothetical protein